jgi:hypothetical protein
MGKEKSRLPRKMILNSALIDATAWLISPSIFFMVL